MNAFLVNVLFIDHGDVHTVAGMVEGWTLLIEDYRKTNDIGNIARENGFDGLIVPSARHEGGSNIVIFKD